MLNNTIAEIEADKAKAKELWETTKMTTSEIAAEIGVKPSEITDWRKSDKWTVRDKSHNRKDVPVKVRCQVCGQYEIQTNVAMGVYPHCQGG